MSTATQVMSVDSSGSSPMDTSLSSIRATKRKLDDALQSLDTAVSTINSASERPPPSKRPHLTRSLYSTLAKYGVKANEPKLPVETADKQYISKSAPHLAAILARAASRSKSRGTTPFAYPSAPASASPASDYRPSSIQSFLSRLSTYKLSTYANKPSQIDAVAAAKCGWINDGKDRLVCGICDVSWVVAGRDGMTREAANALIEKQRAQLVGMHKDGCPWRTRQCDSSIYRVPLQPPIIMAQEIKSNAFTLEPLLTDVQIKHPLSTSQFSSLRTTITSLKSTQTEQGSEDGSVMQVDANPEPSDNAIVTALFGWSMAPPSISSDRKRTLSLSRIGSLSRPASPSISRASSVSRSVQWGRGDSPSPMPSSPLASISQLGGAPMRARTPRLSDFGRSARDTSLLHCSLCQRRVGLWAFTSHATTLQEGSSPSPLSTKDKQFDVLNEHRSYCPYVARSTVVPRLPTPLSLPVTKKSEDGAIEGWRAVLTVVLRHGLSERQRMARFSLPGGGGEVIREADNELEGVEAMVAGVKSKGGRELLSYVKGLLG